MVSSSMSLGRSDHDKPMSLQNLPYDLLLNIAQYLDLNDIDALQLTCKTLYGFTTTRPVFRKLAHDLLCRCRALPLTGFQRLSDLSTTQLVQSVHRASHFERAWRSRAPEPVFSSPFFSSPRVGLKVPGDLNGSTEDTWYKIVSAPPDEEIDWLSPITSSFTLCATKSGKVVCWDVHNDRCIAEWNPNEKWELWKCRVEFEDRMVFFTMAKVISPTYDDDRVMEFVLMCLKFSEPFASGRTFRNVNGRKSCFDAPVFSRVTSFKTSGVVMNVFLLDPPARLLSAFVWVERSSTIGLFALLDWNTDEYVFIDTGIKCLMSSNWSCILHEEHIVIHSEESGSASQHFYPIDLLRTHIRPISPSSPLPVISGLVSPATVLTKKFIFPVLDSSSDTDTPEPEPPARPMTPVHGSIATSLLSMTTDPDDFDDDEGDGEDDGDSELDANPFPSPPWYPESAHFVRQWWPTLPGVPRLSCTVILLARHDLTTHQTTFVLTQHYFRVPLTNTSWAGEGKGKGKGSETDDEKDSMMRLWYVSHPFEVVCVVDGMEEDERPRPLVAVDFGHAVWIEYVEEVDQKTHKRLRFVTFPSVDGDVPDRMEGTVRTLAVPAELDLNCIETINIDQSQGAIILSVKDGKIFILCYE